MKLPDVYFVNKFHVYFVNKLHVLFEISEIKFKVKLGEFESRLCKFLTIKCFYLLKNSRTLTQVCLSFANTALVLCFFNEITVLSRKANARQGQTVKLVRIK